MDTPGFGSSGSGRSFPLGARASRTVLPSRRCEYEHRRTCSSIRSRSLPVSKWRFSRRWRGRALGSATAHLAGVVEPVAGTKGWPRSCAGSSEGACSRGQRRLWLRIVGFQHRLFRHGFRTFGAPWSVLLLLGTRWHHLSPRDAAAWPIRPWFRRPGPLRKSARHGFVAKLAACNQFLNGRLSGYRGPSD